MTISSETRKAGPFPGNGVTTAFPFAFKVFVAADLAVTLNVLATGVQTTLTLTSDYTVALNPDQNANPGGTVTYNPSGVPMPSTKTLTIGSALTNTQGYQPTNSGGWLPTNAGDAWDRAVILIQQVSEKVARSLKFPIVDGTLTAELPPAAQRASKLLGFDASGNVTAVIPSAQSAAALQTILADQADTANGATLIGYLGGTLRTFLGSLLTASQLAASTGASLIGWIQAGTGAVLRTVRDKLRERISVKDYGATGDGVTDDTVAIQACYTANPGKLIFWPNGVYLVSAVINVATNTATLGESRDSTQIMRSATHTGHTFSIGVNTPGLHAGAFSIRNIWFRRVLVFNPGGTAYNAGVSTSIVNRLTGGQAHVYLEQCQRGAIENCAFENMPYHIIFNGGSVTSLTGNHFDGSINDQLTAALQEGIAAVWFKKATGGIVPTLISSSRNYVSGSFGSAARNVTIGTVTANYSESCGPKYGYLIDGIEGLTIKGDYFGGQNEHSIYATPSAAGGICTNIKISDSFFDGARLNCIDLSHQDATGASVLVTITDNCFNGETVAQRALAIEGGGFTATPSAYSVTFANNVVMAFEYTPIYISTGVGVTVSDNIVSGYHSRTGLAGDPAGAGGAYVVGSVADKINFSGNAWGGATNNLSNTNNCQYGVFFGSTFVNYVSAVNEHNNGLGLAGGAFLTLPTDVIAPTLLGAWVNNGAGSQTAGYWKDATGTVHLQGSVKSGVIGTAVFNLPAGYRPVAQVFFPTVSNGLFAYGNVNVTGDVFTITGSNVIWSLDGVSFKAA